jgi:hypothetical protein
MKTEQLLFQYATQFSRVLGKTWVFEVIAMMAQFAQMGWSQRKMMVTYELFCDFE